MTYRTHKRLLAAAVTAASLSWAPTQAAPPPPDNTPAPAQQQRVDPPVRTLLLEAGSGRVLSVAGETANIFVADPKIAEVRPASPTSLFVFGVTAGHTTVAALDTNGHLLVQYQVTVQPSAFGAHEAEAAINRLIPGGRVKVQAQGKGMMLTGVVKNPADAAQAVAIAKGFLSEGALIDNEISIAAPLQVNLSVRIAQMSRQVVRGMGVNWSAFAQTGTIGHLAALTLQFNTTSLPGASGAGFLGLIDALASDNLAQVLAEPNLTVLSGQAASFQVGGEFPIPLAAANNTISVGYKNYGVLLSFVPTVLTDGRINLHVKPEVSELSSLNSVNLGTGTGVSLVIPAITVRRAETTVELGSGESFAIAGLLQQTVNDKGSGVTGLRDLPYAGALFNDSNFTRTDTELVIVATPYVVRPLSRPSALRLPTDGYTPAPDIERLLLMRQVSQNRKPAPVPMPGNAGFVVQ